MQEGRAESVSQMCRSVRGHLSLWWGRTRADSILVAHRSAWSSPNIEEQVLRVFRFKAIGCGSHYGD